MSASNRARLWSNGLAAVAFVVQTAILDALVWPAYVPAP
jgi:hypothetical protein